MNITIENHILLINFGEHLVIIITRHSLGEAIKRHRGLIFVANLMQTSLVGIKVIFAYTMRSNNARANLIAINRLGYILGNIATCLIRNITNKNKTVLPTGCEERVMAGDIRGITVDQLLRDIKKNAMIMGAAAQRTKFADEPMPDLFTVIFAQAIKE